MYTRLILGISLTAATACAPIVSSTRGRVAGTIAADRLVARLAASPIFPLERNRISALFDAVDYERVVKESFEVPSEEYALRWESEDGTCFGHFVSEFASIPGVSPIDRVQIGCVFNAKSEAEQQLTTWVRTLSAAHIVETLRSDEGLQSSIQTDSGRHTLEKRLVREDDGAWGSVIVLTEGFPRSYVH